MGGGEVSDMCPINEMSVENASGEVGQVQKLKHLEFVRLAVIYGAMYAVEILNFGKNRSGSLKPCVENVEETVRSVMAPIAPMIETKSLEILQFLDKQVDGTIKLLDTSFPQSIKDRSFQVYDTAANVAVNVVKSVPDAASNLVGAVQQQNAYSTAKGLCDQYVPVAEAYGKQVFQTLVALPIMPVIVGTARLGGERVNDVLLSLKDTRRVPLAGYIPLLPVDCLDKLVPAGVYHEQE